MDQDLKQKWWTWHKANPEVFEAFEIIAFDLIKQGHKHYSSDAILHIVRFNLNKAKGPEDQYKINNNYSAYYARLFMHYHPRYNDFFETRQTHDTKTDVPPSPQAIKNVLDRGRSLFSQPSVLGDPGRQPVQPADAAPTNQKIAVEKWLEANG